MSFLCFLKTSLAHGDLDVQIERLTQLIEKEPNNANLYLKRGQLHAQHDDFVNAKKDYLQARSLDGRLYETDLLMACLYAKNALPDSAMHFVGVFLKQQPNDGLALITRAGIHRQMGQWDLCQKDLEMAMEVVKEVTPGHFTNISEAVLLADSSNVEEALDWLEKGTERFGFDIVLMSKKVELLTHSHQFEAAIRIVDEITGQVPRKEKWLFEKALIQEKAGQLDLAKTECRSALAAIYALPQRVQKTPKMLELEARVYLKLEALAGG